MEHRHKDRLKDIHRDKHKEKHNDRQNDKHIKDTKTLIYKQKYLNYNLFISLENGILLTICSTIFINYWCNIVCLQQTYANRVE